MAQMLLRGRGCLAGIADMAAALGMTRPLIVGGHAAETVSRLLNGAPVFSGYHANPEWTDAIRGYGVLKASGCDGLVGIGGGSAMDTAKAIKACALTGGDAEAALRGAYPADVLRLPVIAVPTTAGTGSEATPAAVLYIGKKKINPGCPALLPEGVILDPALLDDLPDAEKKAGACDAMAQGIESLWSNSRTAESAPHALAAAVGAWESIAPWLKGGDAEAAQRAAYESGLAIAVTRTTAAHAMSYGLTKNLGIRHGQACMLTLPFLWLRLLESGERLPVLNEIAGAMGLSAEDAPLALLGMTEDLGLRPDIVPEEMLLDTLAATVEPNRLGNHPQRLTAADLKDVYRRALSPLPEDVKTRALALWRDHAV